MKKIVKINTGAEELDALIEGAIGTPIEVNVPDDFHNDKIDSDDASISKSDDSCSKAFESVTKSTASNLENTLNSIQREFEEDVTINIGNLKEKALMESAIKGKWASKLMAEKVRGKILKKNHDELMEGLQKMFSKDSAKSFLGGRQNVENLVGNNSEIREIRQEMSDNRQIVDFLEYCWEVIKGFGFTVKNSLEAAKLEMGL